MTAEEWADYILDKANKTFRDFHPTTRKAIIDAVQAMLEEGFREGVATNIAPLPDIGEDPMHGPYEQYRGWPVTERLRLAYSLQQKHVPDQTALVWHMRPGIYADGISAPQGSRRSVQARAFRSG